MVYQQLRSIYLKCGPHKGVDGSATTKGMKSLPGLKKMVNVQAVWADKIVWEPVRASKFDQK